MVNNSGETRLDVPQIELTRLVCVILGYRRDLRSTNQDLPSDEDVINVIKTLLFWAREIKSLDQMITTMEQTLSTLWMQYLNAIRPRLQLLDSNLTAEEVLARAKVVQPEFEKALKRNGYQPHGYIDSPVTETEVIERAAFDYLQLHAENDRRRALQRSEFVLDELWMGSQ